MVMAIEVFDGLVFDLFRQSNSTAQPAEFKKSPESGLERADWRAIVFSLKALLRHISSPLVSGNQADLSKKTATKKPVTSIAKTEKKASSDDQNPLLRSFVSIIRLLNDPATSADVTFSVQSESAQLKVDLIQKFFVQILKCILNMTSSPTSQSIKPARVAPPIPKQARPLPPPPIPGHSNVLSLTMTSSPPVPARSKSLVRDAFLFDTSDSNIFFCSSEEESSEGELSPTNSIVNKTISRVICRQLFNPASPDRDLSHGDHDDTMLTKPVPEADPLPNSSCGTVVTTPDSGCGTAEDDSSAYHSSEKQEPVFIPKLDLQGAIEDDVTPDVRVPRLDLSEIVPDDDVTRSMTPPRSIPMKPRRRRKKGFRSSPPRAPSPPAVSSPIDIPVISIPDPQESDGSMDPSPSDGSIRWRDAWSTDEETLPMAAMENLIKRDFGHPIGDEEFEMAPSSPENHIPYLLPHHHHHHHRHHHHHKRHHHHEGHLNRPKISNSLRRETQNYDHIMTSLDEILKALDINRKENARPEDITLMTREQIRMEKVAMQRELLKHENRHGRPTSKQEKEIMRNVYERYRMVKRLMADTMSPPFKTVHRRFDHFDYDVNVMQASDNFAVPQFIALAPPDGTRRLKDYKIEANDHISADLTITELRRQHREAKGKRKTLKRKLRHFEEEIELQYQRSINETDKLSMAAEYSEYHDLKLKLRLLDALIEKRNAQSR